MGSNEISAAGVKTVKAKPILLQQQALTKLKGVGKQLALRLEKLGLFTLQDLLFHLPYRYVDRTKITPIGQLIPHQTAVIEGDISGASVVFGKRRSLVCRLKDGTGTISLRFYHFNASQKQALEGGDNGGRLRCYGEVRPGASGLEMYHPEYQVYSADSPPALEQTLTPAYHTTEGISQPRLRSLIEQAFQMASDTMLPNLSPNTGDHDISLLQRLHYLHFPPQNASLDALLEGEHPYQEQLIVEELTAYQLSLLRLREKRLQQQAPALTKGAGLVSSFTQSLAFELTVAQQRVCQDVAQDIRQSTPMMRLLQGDVGSGKTVVAAIAALHAIASGKQVALMAPTDILAEQHRASFNTWFEPLGIQVGWLSGKQRVKERREQSAAIAEGRAQLVVGTHALFQDDVRFDDLALVIIDEQHRFGVHQRLSLRDKGVQVDAEESQTPHQLIMTATPIPRTLAMSAYADLEYSVIDELPKGRQPVETVVISQKRREDIIERIFHACQQGRQTYWVCTLIEQSESLSAEAAEDTAAVLIEQLPNIKVGLVHGRLKPKEKEGVMADFKAGNIQLLVATTVIEVGVDVPNASLMVIENPERLGLAQLHQLRGRVGRGSVASHCVLLYGESLSQHSKARLQAMRSTSDGFKIAEIDLELRGPGEVLGTRQTGDIAFKMADLQRDLGLMPSIHEQAKQILSQDPQLAEQLIERWIGHSEQFAQA